MATKTLCDCKRPKCGLEIVGPNAGHEPVTVRSSSGIRFQITVLAGPDGKPVDLRPSCVHTMVAEGELVRENGENGHANGNGNGAGLDRACVELAVVLEEGRK